jgi:hypothetical protein
MASLTPTYNSAFPALQSGGTHLPKRRQSHPISSLPPTFHRSLAPPKYPGYLKETLYGSLALEQYNYLQRKSDTPNSGLRNAPLLRNNEDNELDHLDLRLPTMWNAKDKSKNIEVGSNGQDLIYIGKAAE